MNHARDIKVIITGVNSRKAFDLVNIMERLYGYECILCAGKDHSVQLPLIYGKKIHRIRNTVYRDFSDDFSLLLGKFAGSNLVYLPVSEDGTRLFLKYLEQNPNAKKLGYLLPKAENFDMTSDKIRFQEYCEKHDFPVPRSYGRKDIPLLKNEFRPLILKPKSGQGSVGIKYFNDPEELAELEKYDLNTYVLQEKIQSFNKVAGAFFMCRNGKVISSYTHQRLRTFPMEGGVTVYSRSGNKKEIQKIGADLLKNLNWNGLAMIEFMFDERAKEWKIIELNPRLWGSAMLSAFNGSNMLDKYVKLSCGLELENNRVETKPVYIRWLFPFDVLNWAKGNISGSTFFKFNLKNTCYICFTYASWWRAISYLLYFSINLGSIKRFIKKTS